MKRLIFNIEVFSVEEEKLMFKQKQTKIKDVVKITGLSGDIKTLKLFVKYVEKHIIRI